MQTLSEEYMMTHIGRTDLSLARCSLAVVALALAAPTSFGQHRDVLVQQVEGRLVTGIADFDAGGWTLGARVFSGEFPAEFFTNDPGWNALGSGSPAMPAGAAALPATADLQWDFVPMKIDGAARTLHYWNGSGAVSFGTPPSTDYYAALRSRSGVYYETDGTGDLVVASTLARTGALGSLHDHEIFFLDDDDGNLTTNPADGIYLVSIRLRMVGLDRAAPAVFAFGTPGSTPAALTSAAAWANDRIDMLMPDFAADADGDLAVDGFDVAAWQAGFGLTGGDALQVRGDFTSDDAVNGADFLAWQRQAGLSLANFPGTVSAVQATFAVPEPASWPLAALAAAFFLAFQASRAARVWRQC